MLLLLLLLLDIKIFNQVKKVNEPVIRIDSSPGLEAAGELSQGQRAVAHTHLYKRYK